MCYPHLQLAYWHNAECTFHHVTELSGFIAQKICIFLDIQWHLSCWGARYAWYYI